MSVKQRPYPVDDHNLIFTNPIFRKGLNITVRKGDKYSKIMNPGDSILLLDKTGKNYGSANVVFTETFDVTKFPMYQLEFLLKSFHHSENMNTWDELVKTLNDTYGEGAWGPTITIIGFWV